MSAEERSLHDNEFSGKKSDLKNWSKRFLVYGNWRCYKRLLVGEGKSIGVEKGAHLN